MINLKRKKVYIVDDDEAALSATVVALRQFDYIDIIGSSTSFSELAAALNAGNIDILFLDIDMPDNSGWEIASYINQNYSNTKIIFLTGHPEFALESYSYRALDFLTKPINRLRLQKALSYAVEKAEKNATKKASPKIGLPVKGGIALFSAEDIFYIEKKGRRILIHTNKGIYDTHRYSIGYFEERLSEYGFIRIHQSYLVPIYRIDSIKTDEYGKEHVCVLSGVQEKIPVSRNNLPAVVSALKDEILYIE